MQIAPPVALVAALLVLGCGGDDEEEGAGFRPDDLQVTWTDDRGEPLPDGLGPPDPVLVINTIPGPEHCGWQSAVIMHLAFPVGVPSRTAETTRQYIRDPEQVLGAGLAPLELDATLPDDAEPTGFRNGDIELWLAPSTVDDVAYVGRDGTFEAWPRAPELIACA